MLRLLVGIIVSANIEYTLHIYALRIFATALRYGAFTAHHCVVQAFDGFLFSLLLLIAFGCWFKSILMFQSWCTVQVIETFDRV